MKRVVITGMGALTPIGNNVNDFWQGLITQKNGVGPVTHFDASKFRTKFACEVKGFNPLDFFEKAELRKYDPCTQFALVAAQEAIANAGINFEKLDKHRIGVVWGSANGGIFSLQEEVTAFAKGDGTPKFTPYLLPKMLINIVPGLIAIKYGIRGVNFAVVSACASSNTAFADAVNYIKLDQADMIITGGAEYAVVSSSFGGITAARGLSERNDNPIIASRPFDVNRDGFVIGEGAAALVIESLEHALSRNAPILAEFVSYGLASDAFHMTGPHPEGEGAYLGMTTALKSAGLKPHDIDYLSAHATSTPLGDASELRAISRVFGTMPSLSINGLKSMIGHMLGAAGSAASIAAIKAMQHGIIPPTINTQDVEPAYADKYDFVLNEPRHKEVNYTMNNTFGFGGQIATTILKKYIA